MIKTKPTQGFTIVELLIAFAIVAAMATAAAPLYSNYRTKFKVSRMFMIAQNAQNFVIDDYRNNSTLASINYASNSQTFLTVTEPYITSISISAGVITAVGNATYLGGRAITLTITPTVGTNTDLTWTCSVNNVVYDDFVPQGCK